MPIAIPQSVAKRSTFKAYLSDGVTEATGKILAVVISKNGVGFGNPAGGATNAIEIGNGWYYVDLATGDTDTLGPLIVRATAAGCDPAERIYTVANPHNQNFDGVPNAASNAAGGLLVSAAGGLDMDEMNADVEAIQIGVAAIPTNPLLASSYVAPDNSDIATILGEVQNVTHGLAALLTAINNTPGIDAQAIWSYVSRTLTQSAATVIQSLTAGNISIYNAVDIDLSLTGLADFTGWSRIWFSIKNSPLDTDAESILQIALSNPADPVHDGLLVLNGAPGTPTQGTIAPIGTIGLRVQFQAVAGKTLLPNPTLFYDVKAVIAGVVTPISEGGRCTILGTVTNAIQ